MINIYYYHDPSKNGEVSTKEIGNPYQLLLAPHRFRYRTNKLFLLSTNIAFLIKVVRSFGNCFYSIRK